MICGFAMQYAHADSIPSWVKNNAKWWSEGQIGDSEFVKGIQFLINSEILKVPTSGKTVSKSDQVPSWVKHNAAWWSEGTISEGQFVQGLQYLVDAGIIAVNTQEKSEENQTQTVAGEQSVKVSKIDSDISSCDALTTPADKYTCVSQVQKQREILDKIAKATPYVAGPVTFYYVSSDAVDTGDGVFVTVHTVIENTGSQTSNPDLYCTGPFACAYHLSDGTGDYPPSVFNLTSGHLELIYHKPVAIEWNFYSKENVGKFDFDKSKQYYFKVSEPFGATQIPLKFNGG